MSHSPVNSSLVLPRVTPTFCRKHVCLIALLLAATVVGAQPVINETEHLTQQHPDSTYRLLKSRLDRAMSGPNPLATGDYLQQIGVLLYHQGSYVQAIDYLLQAQKIFRTAEDGNRLAQNRNELGTVYYYNEQVNQALTQFNEALAFYLKTRNPAGLARTYANIGHIYEKKKDIERAFSYQKLALHNSQLANDSESLTKIYENLGSIFEDEARYDSAFVYYQKALTLSRQNGDEVGQIEIINNLGDVFRKTGRYQQGMALSREALQRARQQGERYQLSAALRDIAKTFKLLNQPDSAYSYIEQSRDLTDEIYAAANNRQITLLQTLYDVERKDSEIAQLNAQKRIDLIILSASGMVLLLIGVLGVVMISRQRLKIRNERAANQQNQQIYRTQHELMQVALKNKQLQEENLKGQLELKSKELTTHTLQIIQKNQVLEELKHDLTVVLKDEKRDQKKQLRALVDKISLSFNQDKYWADFRTIFDQVHPAFFQQLTQRFPELTATDMRLVALLKMNISSADIATLLGISTDSLRVTRYRLRKKIGLSEGESLSAFIHSFPVQSQLSPENKLISVP
ncbi:tetratricopeptide repeat protein [Spirosoma linguale]|uniref:TPR repeat-containing protein n=1 Tax=Spirosoma linguale (strain ATCC 33905 / DSM 74 / LMG 10896 / Claus 1) TaxID=504472 RepID=D2QFP3_SPILD|nr:TPR repeat-containing protein [Spirosoma linguale DSM 74]